MKSEEDALNLLCDATEFAGMPPYAREREGDPASNISHPIPYTLHLTPYNLCPMPCTLHPTPYTRNPKPETRTYDLTEQSREMDLRFVSRSLST